jgi:arylsulfatase A-like enzyme
MSRSIALAALFGQICLASFAADKPNFVYFIIDELGYYELSHMGHPEMRTPNIDRLAAEGLRFTQCLAGSSVCAPTRCALLTGKHTGHATVRNNGGFDPLLPGEETIGSMLKRAGYATGGFGKWGNGGRGTSGVPEEHGFDTFFGYYDQVHAHTFFPRYLIHNSQEVPLTGNTGNPQAGQTFSQYRIVEESKRFIRANQNRPFLAYLCWTPPHGRWGLPKNDASWAIYQDKPWGEDAKIYAAMVNMVDRQVGEIRELLRELGLAENTVIFFSGDNGGHEYFASGDRPRGLFGPNVNPKTSVDFRGGKGNLYEGGLRVPFIVHWPGHVSAGKVTDHLAYFPDVMPTIAELAGAECPQDADGISFVPELLGEAAAGRQQPVHKYLYWEIGKQIAVRMGQWKAYCPNAERSVWELYDLSRDISEKEDIAAAHPEILAQMRSHAVDAHRPMPQGVVHDRALVEKDRRYQDAAEKPKAKKKRVKQS